MKAHTHCRVCGTELGSSYLDLGCQPLANQLVHPGYLCEVTQGMISDGLLTVAPLAVTLCRTCGLSQLTVVVDPKVLYSEYRFASGVSGAWRAHCDEFAAQCSPGTDIYAPRKDLGKLVLDIAANDGTLLHAFQCYGWRTLGVEPSNVALAKVGAVGAERDASVPMLRQFWDQHVASAILSEYGPADLVVAQNVLGHVDDAVGFLTAVETVLAPDGRLAVEVPHVRDMILRGEFDTIYHEHLSYWNTKAIVMAARKAGLMLVDIQPLREIHGGSRRYWFKRADGITDERPKIQLPIDDRMYTKFAIDVERTVTQTIRMLEEFRAQGKRLWAFGASAKGAVMLNTLKARGNTVWPGVILDSTTAKQGMLSPGTHIPIRGLPSQDWDCDVLWVMSYNWLAEMKAQAFSRGYRGAYFVTAPTVRIET